MRGVWKLLGCNGYSGLMGRTNIKTVNIESHVGKILLLLLNIDWLIQKRIHHP